MLNIEHVCSFCNDYVSSEELRWTSEGEVYCPACILYVWEMEQEEENERFLNGLRKS